MNLGIDVGGISIPPCAPTGLSNIRFYEALNGEAWLNNATLFGHVDFMNPDFVPTVVEVSSTLSIVTNICKIIIVVTMLSNF